jgi:hypothetical protein
MGMAHRPIAAIANCVDKADTALSENWVLADRPIHDGAGVDALGSGDDRQRPVVGWTGPSRGAREWCLSAGKVSWQPEPREHAVVETGQGADPVARECDNQ